MPIGFAHDQCPASVSVVSTLTWLPDTGPLYGPSHLQSPLPLQASLFFIPITTSDFCSFLREQATCAGSLPYTHSPSPPHSLSRTQEPNLGPHVGSHHHCPSRLPQQDAKAGTESRHSSGSHGSPVTGSAARPNSCPQLLSPQPCRPSFLQHTTRCQAHFSAVKLFLLDSPASPPAAPPQQHAPLPCPCPSTYICTGLLPPNFTMFVPSWSILLVSLWGSLLVSSHS